MSAALKAFLTHRPAALMPPGAARIQQLPLKQPTTVLGTWPCPDGECPPPAPWEPHSHSSTSQEEGPYHTAPGRRTLASPSRCQDLLQPPHVAVPGARGLHGDRLQCPHPFSAHTHALPGKRGSLSHLGTRRRTARNGQTQCLLSAFDSPLLASAGDSCRSRAISSSAGGGVPQGPRPRSLSPTGAQCQSSH